MRIKNKYSEKAKLINIENKDMWNLDITLLVIIRDFLKKFKRQKNGHPAYLTEEEYDNKIKQIIDYFDYAIYNEEYIPKKYNRFEKEFSYLFVEIDNITYLKDQKEEGTLYKVFMESDKIGCIQREAVKKGFEILSEIFSSLWT